MPTAGAGGTTSQPGATPWPDAKWQGPSPRLLAVRKVQLAATAVPALVIAAALGTFAGGVVAAAGGVVIVTAATAVTYIFLSRRLGAWGYAERDDDLMVRRGVMFQRLSVIPYGRMQYIDVTAGPVERSFGLATVRMYTAAAASDARIPGLTADEAARLRDNLASLGEAQATGL